MKRSTAWLTSIVLGLVPLAASAQQVVGQITSVVGDVRVDGPGGTARALSCGDSVYEGDTITTRTGSSAGILMDDVLARVDAMSALRVGRTDEGTPDALLERGRVRMIDAREEGAPARLAARNAQVRVAGNDAEAYVLSEKVGGYAMFCEWDAPLEVSRGAERKHAEPNHCVIAKDTEPLYVADAHEERIPAAGGPPCPPDLGALASPGPHFSPVASRDVAAPPPIDLWSNLAEGISMPRPDPCDDPGSGCARFVMGGGGGLIDELPPPPVENPVGGGGPPILE